MLNVPSNNPHETRMNQIRLILAVAVSGFFVQTALAESLCTDQFVNYATGRLGDPNTGGGATVPGWYNPKAPITVTNGSGSLLGAPLGLVASLGDKVSISNSNMWDVTYLGYYDGCYNVFCDRYTFDQNTETNLASSAEFMG